VKDFPKKVFKTFWRWKMEKLKEKDSKMKMCIFLFYSKLVDQRIFNNKF